MTALFLLAGCGGGGGHDHGDGGPVARGELSGVVVDGDGTPVVNATISVDEDGYRQTKSDSAGSFILQNVAAKDVIVHATQLTGGVDYEGFTTARVYEKVNDTDSTRNVIVTLFPENQLTSISGYVTANGRPLQYAQVSARATGTAVGSSTIAVSGRDGFYRLRGLKLGQAYRVVASSLGFGDQTIDSKTITSDNDEGRTQDFVLTTSPNNPSTAPVLTSIIVYTTPGAATTRALVAGAAGNQATACEAVKRLRHPERASLAPKAIAKPRNTSDGSPVEIDLKWNEYTFGSSMRPFGFLVTRTGLNDPYQLDDPLAVQYADNTVDLDENTAYGYTISAIGTNYVRGGTTGRSAESNSLSTQPLEGLYLADDDVSGRTVGWGDVNQGDVGRASKYYVYVYEGFPTIGSTPVYQTNVPSTQRTITLNDASIVAGHTYYVVVVGVDANDDAESYSTVGRVRPTS